MIEKRLNEPQVKRMLFGAAFLGAVVMLLIIGIWMTVVQAQTLTPEETAGKAVFDYWCAPCHAPGPGHPGTQGLQIKYRGTETPAELEARTDLTPPVVRTFVRQGVLAMAPFRKTEITDAELDRLAAYLSK